MRTTDLEACVVRVGDAEGQTWGTGFLVCPDLAVTCVHVMENRESLRQRLQMARAVLNVLEEQAAWFGPLHVPVHLQIELEEKRKEVARLEAQLRLLKE